MIMGGALAPVDSRRLTILMLVDALNIGGVETHVLTLGKELTRRGHRIIVGTRGGPLLDAYHAEGLETVLLPFQSDDPVAAELTSLLARIRSLAEAQGADIIHAHLVAGMKIAAQVAQETSIPLMLTVHGAFYPQRDLRRATEVCDHVIAVSKPVAKLLVAGLGHPRDRVTVVPNGVDLKLYCPGGGGDAFRKELGISHGPKLVATCSRVAWGKTRGIAAAIEAVSELAEIHDLHFAVVGSGSDTPLVRVMADLVNGRLGRCVVSVVDARPAPVEVYRAADVVLGTARVALEAMSCGRPVIAVGNTGYVGLLKADILEKAWEVYFGDHDQLAPITSRRLRDDLNWVLENTEAAGAMADECRHWVAENFNIERVSQMTEGLYRSLLEAEAPRDVRIEVSTVVPPSAEGPPAPVLETEVRQPDTPGVGDLVSIAIPTYNRGRFLRHCLESISAQSYRPLEVVVVDDSSTDNTEQVVREWWDETSRDEGLSLVYHKLPHNLGVARAQSVAYYLSRAAYIANQDSDDVSHKDRILFQMQFLAKNVDCSIVGTNIGAFQEDISTSRPASWIRYGRDTITANYRDGKHCVCFGTLVFRRIVLERIGGLTSFAEGAEDWEFVARAIVQGFIVDNLKQVLYYYRQHDQQRSAQYYTIRKRMLADISPTGRR
jgi:glycosyltransferase involved in cell wall biosynthesis/GT2 family glycosyltransferase